MSVPTLQFLTDVLPATGPYFVAVEAWGNRVCFTPAEIEQTALRHPHSNMYFSPASFTHADDGSIHRDNEHLTARRVFVLDVDIRPTEGGHYRDFPAAMAGVDGLVSSGSLPPYSYMVSSGLGLHVYWIAPRDMDLLEWTQHNLGFLAQITRANVPELLSDEPTSKRASGLFRVPGSSNVKHGAPLPCSILVATPQLVPEDWMKWFAECPRDAAQRDMGAGGQPSPTMVTAPRYGRLYGHAGRGLGAFYAPTRLNYEKLEAECGVFRYAAYGPERLKYNGWVDMARLLQTYDDGYAKFHELSQLDANRVGGRYTAADTDAKWNEARKNMRVGVSCATLRRSMARGFTNLCEGCPQFQEGKGTPLNLAKFEPPAVTRETIQAVISTVGDTEFSFNINEHRSDTIPPWLRMNDPHNIYEITAENKLQLKSRQADAGVQREPPTTISNMPFWLETVWGQETADDATTANITEQWRFIDTDGVFRPAMFDTDDTADAQRMVRAAKRFGLIIKNPKSAHPLRDYVDYCNMQAKLARARAITIGELGWDDTKTSFVVGSLRYRGNRNADRVTLSGQARVITKQFGIKAVGSWKEQLQVFQMYGHPDVSPIARGLMLFGLCTPLLSFMQESSFLVLLTGASGNGKSAMQRVINGFWGEPRESHLGITDTDKGQMGRIAALHNLPVTFDEITLKDGNDQAGEMRDFALRLTSDVSQAAKEQDGRLREMSETWATIVLASSNVTLEEFIGGGRDKDDAGRKRVVELVLGERSVPRNTEWLALLADMGARRDANYGWLGPMFVDYFITHKDRLLGVLKNNLLLCKAANQVNYSERFRETARALLLTTDHIVQEMGWVSGSSWADGVFEESARNKLARKTRQPVAALNPAGVLAELPPQYHYDAFIAAMRLEYDFGLLRSHNGQAVPLMGGSSRSVLGLILTFSDPGSELTKVDRAQIIIREDAFKEYCDRNGADANWLLTKWANMGIEYGHAPYPDMHRYTKIETGITPTMYFFSVNSATAGI